MQTGIYLQQMNATINGNYFQNIGSGTHASPTLGYGIIAQNCNNSHLFINTNYMQNVRAGIYLIQNPNSLSFLDGNELHASHATINGHLNPLIPDGSGISISQTTNTTTNNIYLLTNKVYDYSTGISLSNLGNSVQIIDNILDMSAGTLEGQTGLYALNCRYNQIEENTFTGSQQSATTGFNALSLRTGILMKNCPDNILQCNVMDNTTYGMRFQQTNIPLIDGAFRGNQFHHHYTGMYFDGAGTGATVGNIGVPSFSNGNQFTTTSNYTAPGGSQTYSTNAGTNKSPGTVYYFTGDGGNVGGTFYPGNALKANIVTGSSTTDYSCSNPGNYPNTLNSGMIKLMDDVVAGTAFADADEAYAATAQYEAQKLIYSLIDSFPALQDTESIYLFYKVNEGSTIGSMDVQYGYIAQLSDSLTFSDSAAYASALARAVNYNNNIYTTANYDYNEKMVMSAYLTTVAAGKNLTTDSPSVAFVTWLAHQCPYTEGDAVYQARGLYTLINADEVYNDDSLCPAHHEMRAMAVSDTVSRQTDTDSSMAYNIHLQPNPAKEFTVLYYNIGIYQQATLAIYDQLGQLVLQQKLLGTSNSYTINTGHLANGVYNYRFILNQLVIKRDKFVVVK